jgi:hypothetical protein
MDLFLGLDQRFFFLGLAGPLRVFNDFAGGVFRRGNLGFRNIFTDQITGAATNTSSNKCN